MHAKHAQSRGSGGTPLRIFLKSSLLRVNFSGILATIWLASYIVVSSCVIKDKRILYIRSYRLLSQEGYTIHRVLPCGALIADAGESMQPHPSS